jgi:hypothetical protein
MIGIKGLAALALCAACGSATAQTVIDLTQPLSQGTVGGTIFETFDFRTAGTGSINSFVRLQNNGTQEGYNTSGRPLTNWPNVNTSPNFTRDLTYGEIPSYVIDGIEYKEFLLDINQLSASPLLSLDQVQIYASSIGGQTTSNLASLGTLVYDLDATGDHYIKLDYSLGTGSGQGDMRMFVPVSNFGNATAGTFIYLYSRFGDNHASNDGFEEWAVRDGGPIIPLPASVWAGGASLLGLGLIRTIRRNRKA